MHQLQISVGQQHPATKAGDQWLSYHWRPCLFQPAGAPQLLTRGGRHGCRDSRRFGGAATILPGGGDQGGDRLHEAAANRLLVEVLVPLEIGFGWIRIDRELASLFEQNSLNFFHSVEAIRGLLGEAATSARRGVLPSSMRWARWSWSCRRGRGRRWEERSAGGFGEGGDEVTELDFFRGAVGMTAQR